jgi:hypothetical protein
MLSESQWSYQLPRPYCPSPSHRASGQGHIFWAPVFVPVAKAILSEFHSSYHSPRLYCPSPSRRGYIIRVPVIVSVAEAILSVYQSSYQSPRPYCPSPSRRTSRWGYTVRVLVIVPVAEDTLFESQSVSNKQILLAACSLLAWILDTEDGGTKYLRNITNFTASHSLQK